MDTWHNLQDLKITVKMKTEIQNLMYFLRRSKCHNKSSSLTQQQRRRNALRNRFSLHGNAKLIIQAGIKRVVW